MYLIPSIPVSDVQDWRTEQLVLRRSTPSPERDWRTELVVLRRPTPSPERALFHLSHPVSVILPRFSVSSRLFLLLLGQIGPHHVSGPVAELCLTAGRWYSLPVDASAVGWLTNRDTHITSLCSSLSYVRRISIPGQRAKFSAVVAVIRASPPTNDVKIDAKNAFRPGERVFGKKFCRNRWCRTGVLNEYTS